MSSQRCLFHSLPRATQAAGRHSTRAGRRAYSSVNAPRDSRKKQLLTIGVTLTAGGIASASFVSDALIRTVHAEAPEEAATRVEPEFEKARRRATSAEDNRALISSQHLQVTQSWENPGLYAWGSNSGRVAAPDSSEKYIKTPRRIPFFDGMVLRDVQLDRSFGAAVDEKGDLLQWGVGYSKDETQPKYTLRGKNLTKLVFSKDRILGLGKDGTVYSVPVSQEEQEEGPKISESSWLPFVSSISSISYRKIQPKNLGYSEKVVDVASGLEHALLLTNSGRVFSAACASADFPQRGQLGIPGLTWTTRPDGPYDMCHEITTLKGFDIDKIAAGDYHSLAADKDGRVFAFGDNSAGQLGMEYNPEAPVVDAPSLLAIQRLYAGTSQTAKVTGIAAGGSNSYFTIDATKVASQGGEDSARGRAALGRVTADTWACGQGIWGNLANNRWTHVQHTPVKIPSLSSLFEYDDKTSTVVPIRLSYLSVGATHAAAVMDNLTSIAGASKSASENDINWGADLVFWGNNEYYQLGTGKRNNANEPLYIQPLDRAAERKFRGKEEHRFQIAPRHRVKVNGRWIDMQQKVVCGRNLTAVYSSV